MPADIQLRDRAREARKRWASVPVARAFYEQLERAARSEIERQLVEDEELLDRA